MIPLKTTDVTLVAKMLNRLKKWPDCVILLQLTSQWNRTKLHSLYVSHSWYVLPAWFRRYEISSNTWGHMSLRSHRSSAPTLIAAANLTELKSALRNVFDALLINQAHYISLQLMFINNGCIKAITRPKTVLLDILVISF